MCLNREPQRKTTQIPADGVVFVLHLHKLENILKLPKDLWLIEQMYTRAALVEKLLPEALVTHQDYIVHVENVHSYF